MTSRSTSRVGSQDDSPGSGSPPPPRWRSTGTRSLSSGALAEPDLASDAGPETRKAANEARIQGFREDTRGHRMRIADEAERRFGRKVSWGATCGDKRVLFTTVATPAMTRLRMPERRVLDTLVDAGRRPVAEPRARVVRPPGRREAGRMARRPPQGARERRGGPPRGTDRLGRIRGGVAARGRPPRSSQAAPPRDRPALSPRGRSRPRVALAANVPSANASATVMCRDPCTS